MESYRDGSSAGGWPPLFSFVGVAGRAAARLRFGRGKKADAHARSPRAVFKFGGEDWSLPVTDFEIGPKILNLPDGLYGWEDLDIEEPEHVLLSVSLGTAHETWHSKLVAGVLRVG